MCFGASPAQSTYLVWGEEGDMAGSGVLSETRDSSGFGWDQKYQQLKKTGHKPAQATRGTWGEDNEWLWVMVTEP